MVDNNEQDKKITDNKSNADEQSVDNDDKALKEDKPKPTIYRCTQMKRY